MKRQTQRKDSIKEKAISKNRQSQRKDNIKEKSKQPQRNDNVKEKATSKKRQSQRKDNLKYKKISKNHFNLPGHSLHHLKGLALEEVRNADTFVLKAREALLIQKFSTFNRGLNQEP